MYGSSNFYFFKVPVPEEGTNQPSKQTSRFEVETTSCAYGKELL